MLQPSEAIIITAEDVYQALVCLERRKNQTAPLSTLAGASEAETKEEEQICSSLVDIINLPGGGDVNLG